MRKKESSDDVLNKVRGLISDTKSDIPETVIDRAHRIGPKISKENGKKSQSIIVRFTTFRHRTILYKNRKNVKDGKVKIRLDLTKSRYLTLCKCYDLLKQNPGAAKFAYCDINCRLKVLMHDDRVHLFDNFDEFDSIVSK